MLSLPKHLGWFVEITILTQPTKMLRKLSMTDLFICQN